MPNFWDNLYLNGTTVPFDYKSNQTLQYNIYIGILLPTSGIVPIIIIIIIIIIIVSAIKSIMLAQLATTGWKSF